MAYDTRGEGRGPPSEFRLRWVNGIIAGERGRYCEAEVDKITAKSRGPASIGLSPDSDENPGDTYFVAKDDDDQEASKEDDANEEGGGEGEGEGKGKAADGDTLTQPSERGLTQPSPPLAKRTRAAGAAAEAAGAAEVNGMVLPASQPTLAALGPQWKRAFGSALALETARGIQEKDWQAKKRNQSKLLSNGRSSLLGTLEV